MRERRLQGTITTGRWTLPVVIFICTICWLLSSSVAYGTGQHHMAYVPFNITDEQLAIVPEWIYRLVAFGIYAVIGYYLIELNNVFAIIRTRASVQTSFFFLLIAACPAMHTAYDGILAVIPIVLSMFLLFRSYHTYSDAPQYVFGAFALLAIGSMFVPKSIYLVPVWIIGTVKFRSLSFRSLFAAIIGLILPYWFLLGHAVWHEQMELFTQPFIEMATFCEPGFGNMPAYGIYTLAYIATILGGCIFQYITEGYKDKLQTRSYLGFMISLTTYCLVLMIAQPNLLSGMLTTTIVCSGMLAAHLFVLTYSKASNIFFIIMMTALIALFILNLFVYL